MGFLVLIVKNTSRNLLRTLLTASCTVMLVLVVTLVWSILAFLDRETTERAQNIKAVVTEKWKIPSQMPFHYAADLERGAASPDAANPVIPSDSMTWSFYGGSTESDPARRSFENLVFAFAMEPRKLLTMMAELEDLGPNDEPEFRAAVEKMQTMRQGIIVGRQRLAAMNLRVGDRITLYGVNYREIDLELEVVGVFPRGRYDTSAAIHRDYLATALDAYAARNNGRKHPLADRFLNLVWLRVPDSAAFARLDQQIESSPLFTSPAVKCETGTSGVSTFLEAYRDLLWGMRYILAPSVIVVLSLIISNAISINVRERRQEMAVLKVLGYRPGQVLVLVLGEALLVGAAAGLLSAVGTWFLVNRVVGGIPFPIAFFPKFDIPAAAIGWGTGVGILSAFLGSFAPAWSAMRIKVTEVFSRVG